MPEDAVVANGDASNSLVDPVDPNDKLDLENGAGGADAGADAGDLTTRNKNSEFKDSLLECPSGGPAKITNRAQVFDSGIKSSSKDR